MKKTNFMAIIVTGLVALSLAGCKNQIDNNEHKYKVELGEIGTRHNEMLTELYQLNNTSRSSDAGTTEDDINAYFGEYEVIATAEFSKDGIVNQLVEKGTVSDVAAEYIFKIENLLNNPLDTFDEMITAIVSIENEAKQVLVDTDYIEFESYADTAKGSLLFWTENLETIDSMNAKEDGRWIIKDFFNKNKHRIAMSAASDAAGAAAGAAIGAALGSEIPGVGTALGAAIVGVASGAISSAMGYKDDCFCVIISLGNLSDKR